MNGTTDSRGMPANTLRLALDAVEWCETVIVDGTPQFAWLSAVDVTDPTTGVLVGRVTWHPDGYWAFEATS